MIKIILVILIGIFLCGCAAQNYQVKKEGEKIFTGESKSDNYTVEPTK